MGGESVEPIRRHSATLVAVVLAVAGGVILALDAFDGAAFAFRLLFLVAACVTIVLIARAREARESALSRTEELQAIEKELRASEQRYRSVLDATTAIVAVTDADGRFTEPQYGWEAYTGQTWDEHRDYGWLQAFHTGDRDNLLDVWQTDVPRQEVYENRIRLWHRPSGAYRYVLVRGAPVVDNGSVREWIGTVTDVHEHTLGEMRIAGAAQLRSAVLSSLQDGLFVTDWHGNIVEVNEAWQRLVGFSRAEALAARPPYPWWPDPDEHPEAWAAIAALEDRLRASRDPIECEISYRHRSGHLVPTLTSVATVRETDRVRLVIGSVKDITERKAAENELRSERDFREAIVAALQEGMFVLSRDGGILEVNDAWTRVTAFERSAVIGLRPPYPWWPPAARERLMDQLLDALGGGTTAELETTIVRSTGEERRVVVTCRPVHDATTGDFVAVVGTYRDITRRSAAEARLRTFAAVTARLATHNDIGGIAHATLSELMAATGAEIGAVGLADADQRTFGVVAEIGLPSYAPDRWRRVSLDHPGPLSVALATSTTIVVTDHAELERRFPSIAPGSRDLGIEAFVAIPLTHAGVAVGVLFLAFRVPHTLSRGEIELLDGATPIVAQALERGRLFEFQRSIASTLQHALLPEPPTGSADLAVAARYQPAVAELEVGGDWFDVVPLTEGRVAVVAGDIVGRGLAAAAVMGQLRSALGALAHTTPSAGEAISRLDRFARRIPGARATTVCYAIVDVGAHTLRFATAGHPPPLLIDEAGNAQYLEQGHSWPLGVVDPDMPRPEAIVALPPGSTLLLYTDGLIERRGHRLEEGLDALAAQASACNGLPVEEMCDELLRVLVPELPSDDIALVAIRLVSADARAFTYRVPAAADELVVMRRRLRGWLGRQHFPTRVNDDIVLAVGEACTNAVEHAYGSDGPNSVVVEAHRVDDDIVLTVRDYGSWRRLAPDPRRNRGLRLMAAVMDDVSVSAAPDGGTRVRMRRNLEVP